MPPCAASRLPPCFAGGRTLWPGTAGSTGAWGADTRSGCRPGPLPLLRGGTHRAARQAGSTGAWGADTRSGCRPGPLPLLRGGTHRAARQAGSTGAWGAGVSFMRRGRRISAMENLYGCGCWHVGHFRSACPILGTRGTGFAGPQGASPSKRHRRATEGQRAAAPSLPAQAWTCPKSRRLWRRHRAAQRRRGCFMPTHRWSAAARDHSVPPVPRRA
jgi:hypothetical protein